MQYLGGKHSLAGRIAEYLESVRPEGGLFVDVFCGGLSITAAMSGARLANDACTPLINLYRGWQSGWRPPSTITEDDYEWIRAVNDPTDPITAFAGFGCSYGGMYQNTFARDPGKGRNFAAVAARGLERKVSRDVRFENEDFEDLIDLLEWSGVDLARCLIYLDPPYRGTTKYGYFDGFDHDRFDAWAVELSARSSVVLSEYEARDPWVEVASFDVRKSRLKGKQTERMYRVP